MLQKVQKKFDEAKRVAIRKLLISLSHELNQLNLACSAQTLSKMIAMAETIRLRPNEQDLIKELKNALNDLRKICDFKTKFLDGLEIAKVNFQERNNNE